MSTRFKPNVTVATVVEHEGKFLMVEEERSIDGVRVINQPAGHLEVNETLTEAALREVLEETCWQVELTGYLGPTLLTGDNDIVYLRHSFTAKPIAFDRSSTRDASIIDVHWLSAQDILSDKWVLRHRVVGELIDREILSSVVPLEIVRSS